MNFNNVFLILFSCVFVVLLYYLITSLISIQKSKFYKLYNNNHSQYFQHNYNTRDDFKNIFCFWNDEVLPPLINECVKKMKRKMPDWNLILLNEKTILKLINESEIPSNLKKLNIQAQSDWYRLYLLYNYGGLWLDISIILNDPDEINTMYKTVVYENMDIGCFVFDLHHFNFNRKKYPCIESWCLFTKSKNNIIKLWLDEFEYAIKIGFYQYAHYIYKNNFVLTNTDISHGVYHTVYKCFIVIAQKNNIDFNKIYIRNAEKTMCRYHIKLYWFAPFIINKLLRCKQRSNIKLIRTDRQHLDFNIDSQKKFLKMYFDIDLN
jgi:hypothetical protein